MTNGGNGELGGQGLPRGAWREPGSGMTSVYSLDGLLVFGLLLVCTCAYLRKVPRLRTWLLSERRGVWGVCHKAAVIGTRLHVAVSVSCLLMAFYVLVGK
ncbi:protein kish-B isoform X1 [Malurus melanocephalus]|uniref:protein kish-B isoform X1 n=1 Tax=Malurus melanocephalus TaxID=175006 RepID=UPI00254973F9|nr:protein kish-B isoform X1 [Malurus melanocephalus]